MAVLNGMIPAQAGVGQTVSTVMITGGSTNFDSTTTLSFGTYPSIVSDFISASQITVQSATVLYATITVQSGCDPGVYDVWAETDVWGVRPETAVGVQLFEVSDKPITQEDFYIPNAWYQT